MAITFDDGVDSITIESPQWPRNDGQTYPMIFRRSRGGRIWTADMGDGSVWEEPVWTWRLQSIADYDDLYDFVVNELNWNELPCNITDPFSNVFTNMHYVSGLPFEQVRYNAYAGTIRFTKDMSQP